MVAAPGSVARAIEYRLCRWQRAPNEECRTVESTLRFERDVGAWHTEGNRAREPAAGIAAMNWIIERSTGTVKQLLQESVGDRPFFYRVINNIGTPFDHTMPSEPRRSPVSDANISSRDVVADSQ